MLSLRISGAGRRPLARIGGIYVADDPSASKDQRNGLKAARAYRRLEKTAMIRQQTPCASMASATFTKPAMFAPTTKLSV